MATHDASARPRRAAPRRRLNRWVRLAASLALVFASVWFVLIPQVPDGQRAMAGLKGVEWPLVALALGVEVMSVVSYTAMTRQLLTGAAPRFSTLLRIDVAVFGASHAMPAGGAAAAALRFRLWRVRGIGRSDALSAAAVEASVGNTVLGALFVLGAMMAAVDGSSISGYVVALVATTASIMLAFAGGWVLVHLPATAASVVASITRPFPAAVRSAAGALVRNLSSRLTGLVRHPAGLRRVTGFAAANWLLDAAVLWIMLAAFGVQTSPGVLLTVYALGNLLAVLPLTPGGLGIVEAVMVPALVGFGVDHAPALLGVLGWRLLQFWLPIPVAGVAYLSLRAEKGSGDMETGRTRRVSYRRAASTRE